MKLITEPKVKILSYTQNPEQVIAAAGKLCYSPVGVEEILKKNSKEQCMIFVNKLLSMGHHSPLEHVSFTFAVEGVSRALTHQLVRHRIASYSQQSQRYVRSNDPEFIIPSMITNLSNENNLLVMAYYNAMERAFEDYEFLTLVMERELITKELEKNPEIKDDPKKLKRLESKCEKIAIENARYVLPNAMETKIVFTMNLRSLINFISERTCTRAQDEIRQLANNIVKEIEKISPEIANCLGAPCQFGKCPEGAMSCGQPLPKKK